MVEKTVNTLESNRNQPFVSVVLSFYNEYDVIPELNKRLRTVLGALKEKGSIHGYELVFVNDNSSDASEELLRQEIEEYNDIVLVNMSRNFGVSECVIAGMEVSKGDIIIYMDADLQDPPEVIPSMIEAWQNDSEAEVVYTTRKKRDGEHWFKLLLTKIGYRFIKSISDIDLPIDSGDFKLLSRRIVDHILSMKEKKPYMRGLVSWVGYKQIPVYYDREERFDGRENTKFPVFSKRVIYGYLDRALISFSDAPLKMILFSGILLSMVSFCYILVVLFQKLMGWYEPGWPALMSATLLIGGMLMMMMGFTGLYVGAIYREVKNRPLYIIKEVVRSK